MTGAKLSVALVLLLVPSVVQADPVRVSGGAVSLAPGTAHNATFRFTGSGFEFGAEDVEEQLITISLPPTNLNTGQSIDLSAFSVVGQNDGNFPARGSFNGSSVLVEGPMWFTATPAFLSCNGATPLSCGADAPFAFRADFTVTDAATGALLFTRPFTGLGSAHGTLWNDGSNISNHLVLSYTFNAAPVPEPGSLLLVTSGLTAWAFRRTRRRSRGTTRELGRA